MSFRREVLAEFQFDEALAVYYVGDDFDLAYRVSRDYQLFQTPGAQVMHYSSPPQGTGGRERMRARMNVVNHRYLSRKLLGDGWKIRVAWAWSEFGIFLLALLWWLAGRGSGRLMGTIEGQWDVLRGRGAAPQPIPTTHGEVRRTMKLRVTLSHRQVGEFRPSQRSGPGNPVAVHLDCDQVLGRPATTPRRACGLGDHPTLARREAVKTSRACSLEPPPDEASSWTETVGGDARARHERRRDAAGTCACTTFGRPPGSRSSETRGSPWPVEDRVLVDDDMKFAPNPITLRKAASGFADSDVIGLERTWSPRPITVAMGTDKNALRLSSNVREGQRGTSSRGSVSTYLSTSHGFGAYRIHAGRAPVRPPGSRHSSFEVRRGS